MNTTNTSAGRSFLCRWQFWTAASVALAVAGGVAWNRHLNAAPTVAIPAPPPLPSPNAFDDFVRAAELHKETEFRTSDGKTVTLTPAQVDAVFADNAAAVEALHVGFTHPFQNLPVRSTKDMGGFHYFSSFRSLARTLGFEAQQRAARGDASGAIDTGLDGLQMGMMLPRGGNSISLLVGIACDAIARRNLWPVVGKLDAAQAAGAARRLEAIDAQRTPLADTLREEKWRGLTERVELLQHQSVPSAYRELMKPSTNGEASDDGSNEAAPSRHPFRNWVSLAFLSKQRVIDDYARWMDTQIAAASQPYNLSSPASYKPTDRMNQTIEGAGVAYRAPFVPAVSEDLLNQAIDGEGVLYRQTQFKDAADRADDGLLTTLLALRAYRLQNGNYPATLDALVASGILRALPADPFARAANAPFGYRRLSGDGFRLYSVGPDGIDDDGRPIDLTRGLSSRAKSAIPYADAADKGDWVVGVDVPAPGSGAK